jgi:hypothetical protein
VERGQLASGRAGISKRLGVAGFLPYNTPIAPARTKGGQ